MLRNLAVALLRPLILLFPARFRRSFGADMLQLYEVKHVDARRRGGEIAVVTLFLRTVRDLL